MSDRIEQLTQHLAETMPELVPGVSLFAYFMPEDCKRGVLLLEGLDVGVEIDHYLPGTVIGGFQMITRAIDHADGHDLAMRASAALTVLNLERPGFFFNYVRPRHLPIRFPRAPGGGLEHSVNFDSRCIVL
jgi:hypothetical protein